MPSEKNSFMANIAPTSLGKSCGFMSRISFSFSSARLGFGQRSCLLSFGELTVCLLYLQMLVGRFCTLAGCNSLDALVFFSPVKSQITQHCLKLRAIKERKVFSVFWQSKGLRWSKVELIFLRSRCCHISDFLKTTVIKTLITEHYT